MTSDGAVVERPLLKSSCRSCGYGFHAIVPTELDRDTVFDDAYDLGLRNADADEARAGSYADQIQRLLLHCVGPEPMPQSLLEFGSATGALLSSLAQRWPLKTALGIEPAAKLVDFARLRVPAPIEIKQGYAEDQVVPARTFDLCISVNVLEHALDPQRFLAACRDAIKDSGAVIAICPDGETANSELLFMDHISSFSVAALETIAARTGLALAETRALMGQQSGFRANLFLPCSAPRAKIASTDAAGLSASRARYLRGWSEIEAAAVAWLRQQRYAMFGTGEFCDLLRAYAPGIVERAEAFVVDLPQSPEVDGRPLLSTKDFLAHPDAVIVAAVHPRNWKRLFRRFSAAGVDIVHPYAFSGFLGELE